MRKATGRIDPKRNTQVIDGWRNTVRLLWVKACEFDGIPVDSKCVCFSKENKYVPFYNKAMQELNNTIKEAQAGGYVGLTIGGARRGG